MRIYATKPVSGYRPVGGHCEFAPPKIIELRLILLV